MENKKTDTASALKDIISHAKEYGFVFPSSEIYDGLQAVYDYGQNGVELKNNLKTVWWKSMTMLQDNVVGIDASIFGTNSPKVTPNTGSSLLTGASFTGLPSFFEVVPFTGFGDSFIQIDCRHFIHVDSPVKVSDLSLTATLYLCGNRCRFSGVRF
jgi:hypothetical protein